MRRTAVSASSRPIVFMVDDNEGDIELAKIAFDENGSNIDFRTAGDGAQAIMVLRGLTAAPMALPSVILLDLNMPKVHGTQVLAFLKGEAALKHIPVLILTTSDSPRDRAQCLAMGAADYLVKPNRLAEFLQMMKNVEGLAHKSDTPQPRPPDSPGGNGAMAFIATALQHFTGTVAPA
jgi:CheY-like chemotaxis protein